MPIEERMVLWQYLLDIAPISMSEEIYRPILPYVDFAAIWVGGDGTEDEGEKQKRGDLQAKITAFWRALCEKLYTERIKVIINSGW